MARRELDGGLEVIFPDGLVLQASTGDEVDGLGMAADAVESDPLLDAIGDASGIEQVAVLRFSGEAGADGLGAMSEAATAGDVEVNVPLGPDESALLLSEEDGVLRWEYPQIGQLAAVPDGLGAAGAETHRVATFRTPYRPLTEERTEASGLGISTQSLLKPLRKIVLRFAARKTAETVASYLERDLREGPMRLVKSGSVLRFVPSDSIKEVFTGEPARRRLLLLVHGTFSSCDGSFGGLLTTAEGRDFLEKALTSYDAVLGFDHKTLTKTVVDNAKELQAALATLAATEVEVDAIAFSRGGLVLRYLTETIWPTQTRFHLNKAVFVGCTNSGTLLADAKHWRKLVDLYTNLVTGAGRIAKLVGGPSTQVASRIVSGGLRGILSFVRYLAEEVTSNEAIPGLASMDPKGRDVTTINQQQTGQPMPKDVDFYVIAADFDHKLFDADNLALRGLPKRFFLEFADGFVDQLFANAQNDLVVDRASMSRIDPWAPDWVKDHHPYDAGDGVYHTIYFSQTETARRLAGWLL